MASFKKYTASGGASEAFSIPSFTSDEIKVRVDGVLKTAATHYNITSYTANGGTVTWTSGNVPSSGTVYIYRDTKILNNAGSDVEGKATYSGGIPLYHTDLNNNQKQVLRALEEKDDQLVQSWDVDTAIIGSSNIIDGSIVDADVNASAAIQGTKINPQFGTQNISLTGNITVSGTVDGRDVSVDGTKLDGVETGATADQTNAEIRAAVEAATDSNVFTDADHTKLNGIATGSNNYVISADLLDEDDFASDSATKVPSQQSTKAYIAATSQPLDADLTTLAGMQSGTASILASGTALTSTISELNLLDGKSVVTSISGSSTNVQLPTAKAVNDHIVNSISEAGGFVPIANEVSFPNTHPDVGEDAGTIVSIADAGGLKVADGSGSGTYAGTAGHSLGATTVGGTAVTITDIDTSLRGTTIAAGKGMLVQTTSTLNTYTYHRLVVDEAGVASAQTLVSAFNDRYQIASSAPSNHPDGSALQDGDLWFDTTNNVMKVYDLGNTTYVQVSAVTDYKLLTVVNDGQTSGSPTYNGSNLSFDLRDGSNAASITSVGQLLVSLNGVLQQPNAGAWSGSNTGFHLEGTNGIKFCSAPASGASVFVTLMGSASSVNVPATNSIVEAAIQTNVVSEEKLKISNSPTNGQFLSAQSGNSGGLTWATPAINLVEDTTPQLGGDLDVNGKIISIGDSSGTTDDRIVLGNGSDFHIYHPGTDSMIDNNTGNLILRCNVNADVGGNILLQPKPGEDGIKVIHDGAVELYYDNAKHFETTAGGAAVSYTNTGLAIGQVGHTGGNVRLDLHSATSGVGCQIRFANDHNDDAYIGLGGDTTGDLLITGGEENIIIKPKGSSAVELYHGTSKKLETTSAGVDITGSESRIIGDLRFDNSDHAGSDIFWDQSSKALEFADGVGAVFGNGDDLQIYHDGSNSFIQNATGDFKIKGDNIRLRGYSADEMQISTYVNGTVALAYDGVQKFETTSSGITVSGDASTGSILKGVIRFTHNDSTTVKAMWDEGGMSGAGHLQVKDGVAFSAGDSSDLQIYHDGTNSIIKNDTNTLVVRTDLFKLTNNADNETLILGNANGAVELYYDNSKKLETTSEAVKIHGITRIQGAESTDAILVLQADEADDYDDYWKLAAQTNGDFVIQNIKNASSWETNLSCTGDGTLEVFHNNSLKGYTTSQGWRVYGDVFPHGDGVYDCGQTGERWDDVYATNGTIQTSDKNEKNTIVDTDLGLSFVNKLKPVSYKFNTGTRTHYGLIAQDVETTLSDISKSTTGFAGFIKEDIPDKLYVEQDEIPEGKKVGDLKKAAYTTYGLRYNEFISPLIKAVQELSAEVDTLKAKVAELEAK